MKAYWNCTKEQLEEMFGFREKGLTEEEVERIRKETGENRLSEGRHKSLLQVFLSQFCDLMVIILIIAAIISMFSGNTESTIVIFLVLLMNAVLGTIQYRKAEKSLDSLRIWRHQRPGLSGMENVRRLHLKRLCPGIM